MGKVLRPGTDACYDFTPDDTDTLLHVSCEWKEPTLHELLTKIQDKWPDATAEQLKIEAKYIHCYALGYDRYDPGDYVNYIVVELVQS